MPRKPCNWEGFFKGGGKMSKEVMREFEAARGDQEKRFNKNFGVSTLEKQYKGTDTWEWDEYDEWLRVEGKLEDFWGEGGCLDHVDEMVKLLRDQDELLRVLCAQLKKNNAFGEDWNNLDLIQRRFVHDQDTIKDLVKVVDRLTDCKESKKRKRGDTDSE